MTYCLNPQCRATSTYHLLGGTFLLSKTIPGKTNKQNPGRGRQRWASPCVNIVIHSKQLFLFWRQETTVSKKGGKVYRVEGLYLDTEIVKGEWGNGKKGRCVENRLGRWVCPGDLKAIISSPGHRRCSFPLQELDSAPCKIRKDRPLEVRRKRDGLHHGMGFRAWASPQGDVGAQSNARLTGDDFQRGRGISLSVWWV